MAAASGFSAADGVGDVALPIFDVERVQMQFSVAADFVAAQVANNVLVLALSNGRILRIDLNRPEDIDDIDLPKKPSEIGVIRRMFMDPTASHLIVCTALGENYYLHQQSRHPRPLARLRGVALESVAWNPALPTSSTREILLGASDGNVYEAFVDAAAEFYKKGEKYLRLLHKLPDGPVTGLWADNVAGPGGQQLRRVLISTQSRLFHLVGRIGPTPGDGSGSVYARLFENEQPTIHELSRPTIAAASALVVSPDEQPDSEHPAGTDASSSSSSKSDRIFAWLSSHGVFHGRLLAAVPASGADLGSRVFAEAKMQQRSQLAASKATEPASSRGGAAGATSALFKAQQRSPASGGSSSGGAASGSAAASTSAETIQAILLTHWHVVHLVGPRVVATNRLTGGVVFDQVILDQGQKAVALVADAQKSTFWLFAGQEIFEIVVRDEDRDVWKIMLGQQHFDAALQYARGPAQKDAVATATGDHLMKKGSFVEAAAVYGKSTKPFEQVALAFMDANQPDALRKYLLVKLGTFKKSAVMQRIMIASWLVEVFMAKLNSLDDTIVTKAELAENLNAAQSKQLLESVRKEYRAFVTKYRADLDRKTVYDIVSSHGREDELLYFADAVDDYNYVLGYWVQRERWKEALAVLKKQTDKDVFYRYSSVLMTHAAQDLVDVLMRHPDLDPRSLIPALLEYDAVFKGPLSQNQATRYLQYVVNQLQSTDPAVHNTLISMYAAHPSKDESALLAYFESQLGGVDKAATTTQPTPSSSGQQQLSQPRTSFDPDFALRLCIQHRRVLSCVHIYTSMGAYPQAVDLALAHGEVELAAAVADRPAGSGAAEAALRKKLWLAIARSVISRQGPDGGRGGIRAAIEFLRRCGDLLKIEDLIPFFPDFVVIDDFKEEICAALDDYGRSIDALRRDMDESAQTAANIKLDVAALDHRYAIVEPGEKCYVCGLPLLSRQFFVFPCQHAFHSDCLGKKVLEQAGVAKSKKIKELQVQISRGLVAGAKKEAMIAELDSLVASACILCSEYAIKRIDEPFIKEGDNDEWAL